MKERQATSPLWMSRRQIVAAGAAALLVACGNGKERYASKVKFNAVDITTMDYPQTWSMPDEQGVRRTNKDFEGKVVLVFFGFTQCPDVCPTTMLEMAEVKESLGAEAGNFQVLFVTVDPERDTPEILRQYLTAFDPSFKALVGTPDELAAMAAKDFKIFYRKVPIEGTDSYTMEHSAGSYLFDPKGKLRLYAKYGTPAPELTQDIQYLLQGN